MKTILTLLIILCMVVDVASAQEKVSDRARAAAYVAPMSHLDLTFMGSVEECLSRSGKVFSGALDILEKQPSFHFLIEYTLFLEAYRAAHPEQAEALDRHIREGRVELGSEWIGLYVTQEEEENIIRNILYAKRYARERYKLELETLQLTDIPSVVPQLPQVCSGLGIKNLVLVRCAPPDSFFWYESPGGARVLTWSARGYNQAGSYGMHANVSGMRHHRLAEYLAQPMTKMIPPLLYCGSDQWLPSQALAPNIDAWNSEPGKPRLAITTPTGYFRAIRAAGVAEKAQVLRGELPSTWPYLEPSHAHISRWDAVANRALDAAERLSTLAWISTGTAYPRAELDSIWRSLLLARDHNYGGQGAGAGHARKFGERHSVILRAQNLSQQAMAVLAERVEAPKESIPIVVFNTLNWNRDDVVHAHVSSYTAAGSMQRDVIPRASAMVLRGSDGQPIPVQITTDRRDTLGEFDLAFVARDVPSLGYATYTLEPATHAEAAEIEANSSIARPRAVQRVWFETESPEVLLENDLLRVAIERATGQVKVTSLQGKPSVALEGLRLEGRQELPRVQRHPPLGLSVDDPAEEKTEAFVPDKANPVRVLREGTVESTLAVRGTVLGAPAEIRYTLSRELPWLEVEARIDWDLRRFGRIELAYQVPLKDARASYGLPFGAGAFGTENLLPGSGPYETDEGLRSSWEATREISRWLDVANESRGVAMATSHRWTRMDRVDSGTAIRCCLVRGGRIRSIDPAMEGPEPRVGLVFTFRFYPHTKSWQTSRIPRAGFEATQPLLAYTVNDTWSPKSLPRRQSLVNAATSSGKGDALLTCLKQAEDGNGVVVRWYESTGSPCQVQPATGAFIESPENTNLQEIPVPRNAGGDQGTSVGAWEITTLRCKLKPPTP